MMTPSHYKRYRLFPLSLDTLLEQRGTNPEETDYRQANCPLVDGHNEAHAHTGRAANRHRGTQTIPHRKRVITNASSHLGVGAARTFGSQRKKRFVAEVFFACRGWPARGKPFAGSRCF